MGGADVEGVVEVEAFIVVEADNGWLWLPYDIALS